MSFNVHYQLYHYNKRHQLKHKSEMIQSKSFVKAFLQMFFVITSNVSQNIIDITNTSRTIPNATAAQLYCLHSGLASGDASWSQRSSYGTTYPPVAHIFADELGIQVGTSATAVAVADDNLVAPIANGTSAGQFVYYGTWSLNYTTGASTSSFDVESIYRNSSGGTIVVAEIGMYCRATTATTWYQSSDSQRFSFCILRDVLGATKTVLDGEYLKVKYTISVSV